MANILEAFFKLDTRSFDQGSKRAQKSAEDLENATDAAASGMQNLDGQMQKVNKTAASTRMTINQLASWIDLLTFAWDGLSGAGFGVFNFSNQVLTTAGSFETLLVRLESIKGSTEEAEKSMQWIKDFDADAPLFQLKSIADGYANLSMVGLKAENIMRQIGDAIAGTGGSEEELQGVIAAFVQMKAKGKASMEELTQIAERGIPAIQILKDKLHLTSKQLEDIGNAGYSVDEVIQALVDGMGDRFGGQMQAQSDLFNGLVANMQNKWMQFLQRIGESGALDYFKQELKELIAQWEQWDADGTLQEWATAISDTMIVMAQLVEMLIRGGAAVFQFVANNQELLLLLAGATLGVSGLTMALTLTTGALTSTAVAAKALMVSLGPIGVALTGIAAGYIALDAAARQSNDSMEQSLTRMKDTLQTLQFFRESIAQLDASGIVSYKVIEQVQQIRAAVMAGNMAQEEGMAIVQQYVDATEAALQQRADLEKQIATQEQLRHAVTQKLQQQTTADTLAYLSSLQQVENSNADEKIRAIQSALQSEVAQLDPTTDIERIVQLHQQAANQIIAVENERAATALEIAERTYQEKANKIHREVDEAGEQATQLKAITRELAEARIAAVQRQYDATRDALEKAKGEYQGYTNRVKQLESAIAAEQQRQGDTLRDMRRADMSESMQYVDKRKEFAQLASDFEQAMADGDLQKAEDIARRREQLAKELADSEMSLAQMRHDAEAMAADADAARRDGDHGRYRQIMEKRKQLVNEIKQIEREAGRNDDFSMRERGLQMVEDAYGQINQAMQAQKSEAQAAADAQQQQVEQLTAALSGLGGTLDGFKSELTNLQVEVNTKASEAALDALKRKLAELKDKVVTVTVNQKGGGGLGVNRSGQVLMRNSGGKVTGPRGIDKVAAWLTAGEFVVTNQQKRAERLRPLLEFLNAAPMPAVYGFLARLQPPTVPEVQQFYNGGVAGSVATPAYPVVNSTTSNTVQRFEVLLTAQNGDSSPPLSGAYEQMQEMVDFMRRAGMAT